eukprot:12800520-Prorocentrum_lima.AAC.1
MTSSLVGSEMCIRDSIQGVFELHYLGIPTVDPHFLTSATQLLLDILFSVSYTHLTLPTICSV